MLPIVSLKKKRSNSKILLDCNNSPYLDTVYRAQKPKSLTSIKQISPIPTKKHLIDVPSEIQKYRDARKSVNSHSSSSFPIDPHKAEEFEEELLSKIEKFYNADPENEFISETEIYQFFYFKIAEYLKPFEKLLKNIQKQLENCLYNSYSEEIKERYKDNIEKFEKIEKKNQILIQKMNGLDEINKKLTQENTKLKESIEDYYRIFQGNPDLLLNYQNIVDQMLKQCEIISEQKKEIKKLRKYEDKFNILVKEIQEKSMIFDEMSRIEKKLLIDNDLLP